MTKGQIAYEVECAARPVQQDGTARRTWQQLGEAERWSWERNPTPRFVYDVAAANMKVLNTITAHKLGII